MNTEGETEEQEIIKALIPKEIISTGGIDIGQTTFVNHQIPIKPNTSCSSSISIKLEKERFLRKEN